MSIARAHGEEMAAEIGVCLLGRQGLVHAGQVGDTQAVPVVQLKELTFVG